MTTTNQAQRTLAVDNKVDEGKSSGCWPLMTRKPNNNKSLDKQNGPPATEDSPSKSGEETDGGEVSDPDECSNYNYGVKSQQPNAVTPESRWQ